MADKMSDEDKIVIADRVLAISLDPMCSNKIGVLCDGRRSLYAYELAARLLGITPAEFLGRKK